VLGYFDDGHPLLVVLAFVEKGCVWLTAPAPRHLVIGAPPPAETKA
jgi:hypothetical protein